MLVVRTQDLRVVFDASAISITKNVIAGLDCTGGIVTLGKYRSAKRAKEVFNEMIEATEIQNERTIIKYLDSDGDLIRSSVANGKYRVYQMPKR